MIWIKGLVLAGTQGILGSASFFFLGGVPRRSPNPRSLDTVTLDGLPLSVPIAESLEGKRAQCQEPPTPSAARALPACLGAPVRSWVEAALHWHPKNGVGCPGPFRSSRTLSVCDQEGELNQALISTHTPAL